MNLDQAIKTGMTKALSIIVILVSNLISVKSQQCSPDAISAKYWQYRERFNNHFVVIDRDSSGCVNDGIGQESTGSCDFSKAGYSLPTTSINMEPDGSFGLRDKGRGAPLPNDPPNPWEDIGCGGNISWDHSTHNYPLEQAAIRRALGFPPPDWMVDPKSEALRDESDFDPT